MRAEARGEARSWAERRGEAKGDASPGGLGPAVVPEASANLLHQEKVVERRRKKAFLALSRAHGHVGITPGLKTQRQEELLENKGRHRVVGGGRLEGSCFFQEGRGRAGNPLNPTALLPGLHQAQKAFGDVLWDSSFGDVPWDAFLSLQDFGKRGSAARRDEITSPPSLLELLRW